MKVSLTLNGKAVLLDAEPSLRLSELLREKAGYCGTKVGCDAGDCGACTVLLDGAAVCACLTPAARVEGRSVQTVEAQSETLTRLRDAFHRHGAAQCGICTPGMLMAAAALLAENPTPTAPEAKEALGGVLCRCTGYTKIIAAVCDTTPSPAIPMPGIGHAVGSATPRLDGAAKLAGDVFGADLWKPDGLVVKAIRSPHAAARFRFGDLAAWAKAHDAQVFTATDIPGRNLFGVIVPYADQPALAENQTRQRGEAVALVAYEDGSTPPDLTDFPVIWEKLHALTSPTEATKPNAPRLHLNRPDNLLIKGHVQRGDPATALADSTHTASADIETSFVEHAYIEPEAGAAWMDGDVLVIRACTQAPIMDRDDTAAILGLPHDRLRIIPSAVGGGFGSKLDVSLQPLIGLVTLKTGRPSRMTYSRAESMSSTTKRHPARMTGRIGCDADGLITGMEFDGTFDTGAYASWGPTVANRVPVHACGPYFTPSYRATARAVHTNNTTAGAFRGFGVPQAAIWQDTVYDRLAEAVGIDRLEFRLKNALRDGQTTVTGQAVNAAGIADCLIALRPHWQRALAQAQTLPNRGVGIASCWYGCGNTGMPNPSTIRLGITPQAVLTLHQGATDIGQGSNTVIAQITADALGLPLAQIQLVGPDTFLTPDGGKTSASRQTYVTGRAAHAAGCTLRADILRRLNMGDGATLILDNTCLTATEGNRRATLDLAEMPTNAQGYALMAEETYDPPTTALDANGQGTPYAVYGYGAQMVELEVDPQLGTVKLYKITAAHDLGRTINPLLATGQIEGGIAQGIGLALMEEFIPGRTENLHDYLIPTTGDVPEIESILIEIADPHGPYGAKGLGEHVLIPTAPAILNAIRHATGAEITRLPALPHRILAAMKKAKP
ncbi:molybdopterin cofactor-binding domain-containing protein [Pseudorhodobacter sp.]|uniref:molybdopterin-dependent oxidoreductase n=1 Tax=Pseudorhodobacter sp. TaxID=1934400 RepID=UPI0026497586|nr:molybdopterin cofactor-binding domain-containing protein [Pseudorhodobacter sp.]MDN5786754.1 molybdopterin-dependent oxidoreductase [Pseudorhodobacter sp.]